ncbi:hypothetical protein HY483_03035 [Candidatus Woesearchaeota archaeon]|nr:hypothetical protein [Candidatus Woesearchaeota archaeon]
MTQIQLSVKNVEEKTFREFKAKSVQEGMNVGLALTLAMQDWIEQSKRKPKRNILDLKAWDWGKGTENISENADSILYDG